MTEPTIEQMVESVEAEATRIAKLRDSGVRDQHVDRHFYALNAAAATLREIKSFRECAPALGDHKLCPTCGTHHD
jgi:hypothetical protein